MSMQRYDANQHAVVLHQQHRMMINDGVNSASIVTDFVGRFRPLSTNPWQLSLPPAPTSPTWQASDRRWKIDYGTSGSGRREKPKIVHWTPLSTRSRSDSIKPAPRHGHRAIPINNKRIVVFGGGNEGLFTGMNILDVEKMEWSQPKITGDYPPYVANFGAVYDDSSYDVSQHRILVFGGMVESNVYSNMLHELKYNAQEDCWVWTCLSPLLNCYGLAAYPFPRHGHSFTIINDKVYMFGGMANVAPYHPCVRTDLFHAKYLNDLYVLNLGINYPHSAWEMPVTFGIPPTPRESHSAVAYSDTSSNKIIFFGGHYGHRLDDLFVLDVDTMFWNRICTKMPYASLGRSLHSASVVGSKMYIFGGWIQNNDLDENTHDAATILKNVSCVNTVACFDIETMTWVNVRSVGKEPVGLLPAPRAGHSAFTVDNRIYIWSGRDGFNKYRGRQHCHNDLWRMDVELPLAPGKCRMNRFLPNALSIAWDPVPGADSYILQMGQSRRK